MTSAWPVQVTDVHLSQSDVKRFHRFMDFVNHTIPQLIPHLVLLTGDITDGRRSFSFEPRGQVQAEWEMYRTALRGALDTAAYLPWLDNRGNHDAFAVTHFGADGDLYPSYRGHAGERDSDAEYEFTLRTR